MSGSEGNVTTTSQSSVGMALLVKTCVEATRRLVFSNFFPKSLYAKRYIVLKFMILLENSHQTIMVYADLSFNRLTHKQ